jgi:endo-1,4-beta-D-glucanase Y
MAQMAIFPLNYGDLDDGQLLDYQDASKITQVNAKQYSALVTTKMNDKAGYKEVEKFATNFSLIWNHPLAQARTLSSAMTIVDSLQQ